MTIGKVKKMYITKARIFVKTSKRKNRHFQAFNMSVPFRAVLLMAAVMTGVTHAFLTAAPTPSSYLRNLRALAANDAAASASATVNDKPRWAGGSDVVSDVVNALISIKPLFAVMKVQARKTLIGTAEKNGIPWRERASALMQEVTALQRYYDEVENKDVTNYPTYYTQEFHAYDAGNLNWQAAVEVESATMSMALRVWPQDGLTAEAAQDRLRGSFFDAVEAYIARGSRATANPFAQAFQALSSPFLSSAPARIIDVGCSVGVSTFYLAERFPSARIIDALDLSPHFLAVAKQRQDRATRLAQGNDKSDDKSDGEGVFAGLQRFAAAAKNVGRIRWIHGNAEATGLPSNSYELVAASFMFHELPQGPSDTILQEMFRLTARGGVVAITDNNPRSPVIQGLPPALFTLMKSTEPWSDDYYTYDLEAALRKVGFVDVETVATDPRHRTVLGRRL